MIIERLTKPSVQPFNMEALAVHCRADGGDFDMELARQGMAAATELETYAQLALIDQTIRVTLDGWPRRSVLPLPIAPVIDALSVTVTEDGIAFEAFAVITGPRPALRLTDARPCGVIVIEYLAGFGSAQSDIPADLVNAVMDQASSLFDMRGAGDGKTNGMSPHMARVAARYRRVAV